MNKSLYEKIKNKELLIALTDKEGNVIWQSDKNPATSLFNAYFDNEFENLKGETEIYSDQAGLAIALISPKLNIKKVHCVKASEVGLEKFKTEGVEVEYEEVIPLVISSKSSVLVCGVERFMSEHPDDNERWSFMEERHKNKGSSCTIWLSKF